MLNLHHLSIVCVEIKMYNGSVLTLPALIGYMSHKVMEHMVFTQRGCVDVLKTGMWPMPAFMYILISLSLSRCLSISFLPSSYLQYPWAGSKVTVPKRPFLQLNRTRMAAVCPSVHKGGHCTVHPDWKVCERPPPQKTVRCYQSSGHNRYVIVLGYVLIWNLLWFLMQQNHMEMEINYH